MSAIRKLTGMGGDVRQIAKLLQAKAPPGHKLAFINEEEAALLKRRGGSGRITPEGLPSYELDDNLQISGALLDADFGVFRLGSKHCPCQRGGFHLGAMEGARQPVRGHEFAESFGI